MASPASTGPAGPHFEGQVGAYYLLAMLAGAEALGLPRFGISLVRLQGAPEGHSLDDVVVYGQDSNGILASLEIQVKRSIDFSPSDEVFAAVMVQVAESVKKPDFWSVRRELAVATSQHSRQIDGPYQDVLTWAREFQDAQSFHRRLRLPKVASDTMRRFVSTFGEHLKKNNVPHDDQTVWEILRRFHILVFDFGSSSSVAEDLAKERAIRLLATGSEYLASDLWKQLIERSIQIAASGGDRSREQLQAEFLSPFQFAPLRRHQEALGALGEVAKQALADIDTRVSGVRLGRQAFVNQLWSCLDNGRYVDIRGDAGVGKSGLIRHFAEQLAMHGRIIVLSPNRTFLGGWSGMRQILGFGGTCHELLSEIALSGGGAIFVDNLDFFTAAERPAVVDLVREAAEVPGVVVVTTARLTFGVNERNWLPTDALDRLGRTAPIFVGEMDAADLEELRNAAPQLSELLRDDHPARDVVRNLFRLSQLAHRPDSNSLPRSEAEMASEWWKQAASELSEGRRDRTRLLKFLAEHSLASTAPADISQISSEPVDVLVKNETLLELRTDYVAFRHDVFREWAVACLLHDAPSELTKLEMTSSATADLGRAFELLARMKIENASDASGWLELLNLVSKDGFHGSWRRVVLLALVRSESSFKILDTAVAVLIAGEGELLRELVRLTVAVEAQPSRVILAAAGFDTSQMPAFLIPSGLSWLRLVAWLVYRLKQHLPPVAIPDVVKLYGAWCMTGTEALTGDLVQQMYGWLREIEVAREEHPYWDSLDVFGGAITGDALKGLEEDLRLYFTAFALRAPALATNYLGTFKTRSYSDQIKIDLLKFRGTLVQAAPAAFVDFTIDILIPNDGEQRRRRGGLSDGPFGFNDGKFLPCSPAQGPFFELLTHSPSDGLRLIRRLVDYSLAFMSGGADPGTDGITIVFPDGPRFFSWQRTYMWSREAYGGPYLVTSALMALEAWAHIRVEKGESVDSILSDIVGEAGAPAAYLLPAVDVILSHWPESKSGAVPFFGSPELLAMDRSRFAADSMPEFPDILGLKAISIEPLGQVKAEDLKKRPSRRWMLDQWLGQYAAEADSSESRSVLQKLLAEASLRLGEPNDTHNFRDPEFMAVHALNMTDRKNWRETTMALNDGTLMPVKEYVAPAAEASQLDRWGAELEARNADKAMGATIAAALKDPNLSTDDFHHRALTFVRRVDSREIISEEDSISGELPLHIQESIKVAFLLARDGSTTLRQSEDQWIKDSLALSFTDGEREKHRYRSEYVFNPQAFSFVGYFWLLKHARTSDNYRQILDAASFENPSASSGFQQIAPAIAGFDERLVRSILRCAFTTRIKPGREWGFSQSEHQQRQATCEGERKARIDNETDWLLNGGSEPAWPQFPRERPSLRHGLRYKTAISGDVEEESPEHRFRVESHGAALWLKSVESLCNVTTHPWLRAVESNYRDWTAMANGAGIEKDEQISGEPTSWNEQYFRLAAACLVGLSPDEAEQQIRSHLGELPDETLFDNTHIFLMAVDELFFNRNAIEPELAVRARVVAASLLRVTRGWSWLQKVRKDSAEMHISKVVSTLFFNENGGFLPTKCYLLPVAVPRITPFLEILGTVATDCRAPLVGLVALNMVEVAPTRQHLVFLIQLGFEWLETYGDDVQFWIEYRFGKRLCLLVEGIVREGEPGLSEGHLATLDPVLSHLVKLGVSEAHQVEKLLRESGKRGVNG